LTTKAAILLTTLGVLNAGIAGVFVGTVLLEEGEDEARVTRIESEQEHRISRRPAPVNAGCAPCSKCRPVVVPVPPSAASCEMACSAVREAEEDRCAQKLEDIQGWCNPYCQEQLDECRQVVFSRFHGSGGFLGHEYY
jgi:hypothetical protein